MSGSKKQLLEKISLARSKAIHAADEKAAVAMQQWINRNSSPASNSSGILLIVISILLGMILLLLAQAVQWQPIMKVQVQKPIIQQYPVTVINQTIETSKIVQQVQAGRNSKCYKLESSQNNKTVHYVCEE